MPWDCGKEHLTNIAGIGSVSADMNFLIRPPELRKATRPCISVEVDP